jgi:hypothetical protein
MPDNKAMNEQELLIELQNSEVQGIPLKNILSGSRMKEVLALIQAYTEQVSKRKEIEAEIAVNEAWLSLDRMIDPREIQLEVGRLELELKKLTEAGELPTNYKGGE